jgi:hypothetical protein
MEKSIKVAAGQTMPDIRGTKIRPLFENTGVPGYFSMTMDIPPHFLDMEMPQRDYALMFYDVKVPRIDLQCGNVQLPTVEQVLWAIGWASVELMNVVSEKPIRFLHPPFRAHNCSWWHRNAWRQIVVSRHKEGYSVETVGVAQASDNTYLGYLRPA